MHQTQEHASNQCDPRLSSFRSLRLSLTDKCNLRCIYCMPPEGVPHRTHDTLLNFETLVPIIAWLVRRTAIRRIRLTGGEPLLRKGICSAVRMLGAMEGIGELALTTNGILLPALAAELKQAGLKRVNISLDTLDPDRFRELTRGGEVHRTLAGIDAALAAGLTPVKLNCVLRRSSWRQDLPSLLDYAAGRGLEIRFIELMQTGTSSAWCDRESIAASEVWRELDLEWCAEDRAADSPARSSLVRWRGSTLHVGWITPRSHAFCNRCSRLRMDAQGRLRRCLMDDRTLPLHELLRDEGQEAAARILVTYLQSKKSPNAMVQLLAMSQIGG